MTKEEILAKSRSENQNKDYADLEVQGKGAVFACFAACFLCCAMTFLEKIISGKFNPGYLTVFFGMLFSLFIVKVIKQKKLHEIFVASCYGILFICGICFSVMTFYAK